LILKQFEECHPHGYLVKQCIDQQLRSALSSFPQYHLQFNTHQLILKQFEECHPHGYLVKQCIDQQLRSALSSFPQYHLQFNSK
ncbi:hypothetical protein T06_15016, partial [Trichinella sp. T6]